MTYAPRCSPFWEVFGNPADNIIKLARTMWDREHLTLLVPVEFWTNPTQREGVLRKIREEDQGVSLQIDLGDGLKTILKRGTGL